jgi:hypothetical protein
MVRRNRSRAMAVDGAVDRVLENPPQRRRGQQQHDRRNTNMAPEQRDHRHPEQRDLKRAQRPPRRHPQCENSENQDGREDPERGSLYPV